MDGNQVYQPLSRPPTNYLDVAISATRSDATGEFGAPGPSDVEIDRAVQTILHATDLNSITKRETQRRLEEHFGVNLVSCSTYTGTDANLVVGERLLHSCGAGAT